MPAFHLVVLLARHASIATALQREPAVVQFDADLLARHAGQLRGHHERLRGFTQVHGRCPTLGPRGHAFETVLNGQEIAEGVPPSKCHDPIVAP